MFEGERTGRFVHRVHDEWPDLVDEQQELLMAIGIESDPEHLSPRRTPTRTERRIIKVRLLRRWGPARIAYFLRLTPATVSSPATDSPAWYTSTAPQATRYDATSVPPQAS